MAFKNEKHGKWHKAWRGSIARTHFINIHEYGNHRSASSIPPHTMRCWRRCAPTCAGSAPTSRRSSSLSGYPTL